jgi:hypothetical protein
MSNIISLIQRKTLKETWNKSNRNFSQTLVEISWKHEQDVIFYDLKSILLRFEQKRELKEEEVEFSEESKVKEQKMYQKK